MNAVPDGVFLVDKPSGMTSARVLERIKRSLRDVKKIGHAGTLDPLGTGLLICLTGRATRLAQYAESGMKEYTGTIRLGLCTKTDDIEGEVLKEESFRPSDERIEEVTEILRSRSVQRPPEVSAIRIQGKRAYQLQRMGETFELEERLIHLESLELKRVDGDTLSYRVVCGKGVYIRSLARDAGELLGCGACVESLRRVASYPFVVSEATPLDELDSSHRIAWDRLFPSAAQFVPDPGTIQGLVSGNVQTLQRLEITENVPFCIYRDSDGNPLGLLVREENSWSIGVNIGVPATQQGGDACLH